MVAKVEADGYCCLNDRLEADKNESCEACTIDGEYDDAYGRNALSVDARTVL